MEIFLREFWLLKTLLLALFLFFGSLGIKHLFRAFERRGYPHILYICYAPIISLFCILSISYVVHIISVRFDFLFEVHSIRNALIVLCLSWLLLRWKKVVQRSLTLLHPTTAPVVGRLVSIAIALLSLLFILQILGLNVLPLIAFGGIGAAALGFAAKDVIGNFFGGLMLYTTHPFSVGDLILLPDKSLEGTVEEIGWYLTTVRDKDKRPVYLPNAIFSHQLVINSSRMTHRRILETVTLSYSDLDKIKNVMETLRAVIAAHPAIDKSFPILVHFSAFDDYALNIYVDTYTTATDFPSYLQVKEEILLRIGEAIAASHAEMPFPTMHIELDKP